MRRSWPDARHGARGGPWGHPPPSPHLPGDQATVDLMKLACICGCFNRSFDAGTMDQPGFIRHCAITLGVRGVELQDIHFPQTRPAYLQELRRTAADLELAIVGIGVHNDFGRAASTWR